MGACTSRDKEFDAVQVSSDVKPWTNKQCCTGAATDSLAPLSLNLNLQYFPPKYAAPIPRTVAG